MSYRIIFLPAYFNDDPTDQAGADAVIAEGATEEEIIEIAKQLAWHLPLGIWTCDENDLHLKKFLQVLEDDYSQEVSSDRIYVKSRPHIS